jgi:hypothetical protein
MIAPDPARASVESLWAITSYFNPMSYQRRRANYRLFRERLNVPLVTVELAYGRDFELSDGDADILVQLRARDILWQKERLLNLALGALPNHCRNVVSVDCDIVFETDDWPEHLSRLLRHSIILQPFSHMYSLPPDWVPGEFWPSAGVSSHTSATFAIGSGVPAANCIGEIMPRDGSYTYARGFAWAARRELLDQHGFYDACIIGNGDRAMAAAIYGCYDAVMNFQCMNDRQRARYLAWAEPFHQTVGNAAGWMNGNIYHLWHGEMQDRGYQARHENLARFKFDPFEDIAVDDSGCWRWNTDKPLLHDYVKGYFASRKEDG